MEGKFDILLVFMFDRLGRRDDETPFIVEWFTKQGIEVWSVNEGQQRFDTHVDKLMNYIRYWQASGESLKTSVRTRTRLEQLTGEGHYTGGTVPYGYKRVRLGRVNKKNQEVCDLVIDEAEAEIVRLIFHKYVYEGYGAQKLSHYLYEQGVVGRNNKNIPNTSIVRMIKNKGYTGYLINGAVETECPQLRIIEPELFEQAQELRQARTCERGGTSLGTSSKALLTGLVYCGHCGNRLSLTSSGRTHTYADGHTVKEVRPRYSCFYKIRHPGDCDGQSGYGVSKLDSIVEEVVRQIFAQFREVSRKKLLESVKTNDAARIQKKIKKIQKDLEAKQKELDDLKAETILVIRGVSALDKELLGTLVAEAREALETLEKQLVQSFGASSGTAESDSVTLQVLALAQRVLHTAVSPGEAAALLRRCRIPEPLFSISPPQELQRRVTALCLAARDLLAERRRDGVSLLCAQAMETIEKQYMEEDLSLSGVSEQLHVSPNYLSANMKKYAGDTFMNLLIKKRMEIAHALLTTTGLKIYEVARQCGYSDQHYFSFCFKKYYGTSPAQLRRAESERGGGGT